MVGLYPGAYKNPEQKKQIDAIRRSMEIDPEYFSAWEREFLRSVDSKLAWGCILSDAQAKAFTKLHQKCLKR